MSALLIEPQGIEISKGKRWDKGNRSFNRTTRNWNLTGRRLLHHSRGLLIEPQGIEMAVHYRKWFMYLLLIEPQGIEIRHRYSISKRKMLLIEPQGIEMSLCNVDLRSINSFNRTTRNWNPDCESLEASGCLLLIEPQGIEMSILIIIMYEFSTFNRTTRNWNFVRKVPVNPIRCF